MISNIHYPRTARVEPLESVGHQAGCQAAYQERSKRWSDDLGFQGSNPWSDFRGGGNPSVEGGKGDPKFWVLLLPLRVAATQLHWDFHKSQAIIRIPINPSI